MDKLTEVKDELSLSKISKDEIDRMKRMRHIYIEKKMHGTK